MVTSCSGGGTHCADITTSVDTEYTYYVRCVDSVGTPNESTTTTITWTEGGAADETAPVLSDVQTVATDDLRHFPTD